MFNCMPNANTISKKKLHWSMLFKCTIGNVKVVHCPVRLIFPPSSKTEDTFLSARVRKITTLGYLLR